MFKKIVLVLEGAIEIYAVIEARIEDYSFDHAFGTEKRSQVEWEIDYFYFIDGDGKRKMISFPRLAIEMIEYWIKENGQVPTKEEIKEDNLVNE
jgi:hypothetical protein